MDAMLWVIGTRAFERVLVVLVGAFAIWLGFRLFRMLPRRREGESRLELPGGVSVYLSRIGPGVFFALFGAGLIGYSASRPVALTDGLALAKPATAAATATPAATGRGYVGATGGIALDTGGTAPALPVEAVLSGLNRLAGHASALENAGERLDLLLAVREAKLTVLRAEWDAERFGPYPVFRRWVVEEAAQPPAPAEVAAAARLFAAGSP